MASMNPHQIPTRPLSAEIEWLLTTMVTYAYVVVPSGPRVSALEPTGGAFHAGQAGVNGLGEVDIREYW